MTRRRLIDAQTTRMTIAPMGSVQLSDRNAIVRPRQSPVTLIRGSDCGASTTAVETSDRDRRVSAAHGPLPQAAGSRPRTPPLWGRRLCRPLLHDGSAATADEAIRRHGNEAALARGRVRPRRPNCARRSMPGAWPAPPRRRGKPRGRQAQRRVADSGRNISKFGSTPARGPTTAGSSCHSVRRSDAERRSGVAAAEARTVHGGSATTVMVRIGAARGGHPRRRRRLATPRSC